MTEDEFWKIISEINARSSGDVDAKERLLQEILEQSDPEAVLAFSRHMDNKMDEAYTWPLWAAAYIIHGGCRDDSFMDFRSSLICMGRETYEAACKSPAPLNTSDSDTLRDCFTKVFFRLN